MTDRKLKRLLAEKPFLIDDNFSMTGGEAELMLMENSPLSIEDMLVKARQKDGWKPEFEQMINRILANTPIARWNRLRVNLQTGLQHTWAFHAKAVVTWVIILLLTAVMVFTPVGKAVAESITQLFVSISPEGIIIAHNPEKYAFATPVPQNIVSPTVKTGETNAIPQILLQNEESSYSDLSSFVQETNRHPVHLPENRYHLASVDVSIIPDILEYVQLTYYTQNGVEITIWQTWGADTQAVLTPEENDVLIETTILDDVSVHGYYNPTKNQVFVTAAIDDSIFELSFAVIMTIKCFCMI